MVSRLIRNVTLPLMALSVTMLAVGGLTAWYVHVQQQRVSAVLVDSIALSRATETLEDELQALRGCLQGLGTPEAAPTGDSVLLLTERVEVALAANEDLARGRPDQPMVVQIRRDYALFSQSVRDHMPEILQSENRQQALKTLDDMLTGTLLQHASKHQQSQTARITQMARDTSRFSARVVNALLVVGLCGAFGGLAAGIAAARRLRQSMLELSIPVNVAAGALNSVVGPVRIPADATYGQLRDALNQMAQDVTATVERLQASQHVSLRSEQLASIGQLAAGLAHEIRNPLTSMKSLIQLAHAEGGASSLSDRDVQVLDEEIGRLDRQVQTFLDFARPPRLNRTVIDLVPLVEKTIALAEPRARQQRINLKMFTPDQPVLVDGDPDQLQQVLLNLILNAIDMVQKDGHVNVNLFDNSSTGTIKLEVVDDGPGIPAEMSDRIFEPFFSTRESGTGIGLAVSLRIVEQHNGSIVAANRDHGGAVFTATLPGVNRNETSGEL
jgi:two-component system, NtrC family, sensor histidine kinase HydH